MITFKRAIPLLALCVLSGFSQTSLAAYQEKAPGSYTYIGYGVGYGRINGEDFTNANNDLTESRVSWKAILGTKINQALSIEAQYVDFGAADKNTDRIKASGWTAGATMDFMQGSSLTPYGKVGALFWETDNLFSGISLHQKGTDLTLGLGLRFAVTDHLVIRTEYERFAMDNSDVDNLSATLQYNFF